MADPRLRNYDETYLLCRGFVRHAYALAEDDPEVMPHFPRSRSTRRYAKVCINCGRFVYFALNRLTGERLYYIPRYPEGYLINLDEGDRVSQADVRIETARRLG
jgi:hypothetical protein